MDLSVRTLYDQIWAYARFINMSTGVDLSVRTLYDQIWAYARFINMSAGVDLSVHTLYDQIWAYARFINEAPELYWTQLATLYRGQERSSLQHSALKQRASL